MLVLSRRVGDSIHVGDDIVVTVLGFHGRQIRIGIEAPTDVPIRREELALSGVGREVRDGFQAQRVVPDVRRKHDRNAGFLFSERALAHPR